MGARDPNNSLPAESRVGLVRKLKRVPRIAATHSLQSQEYA